MECFSSKDACKITPDCKLAGILHHAFEALYASLNQYTQADLLTQPQPLIQILQRLR